MQTKELLRVSRVWNSSARFNWLHTDSISSFLEKKLKKIMIPDSKISWRSIDFIPLNNEILWSVQKEKIISINISYANEHSLKIGFCSEWPC